MNTKKINEHQMNLYAEYESSTVTQYLSDYCTVLSSYKNKKELKILDIGGASGFFASKIKDYFNESNCQVYVIDTTSYPSWEELSVNISFIEGSIHDTNEILKLGSFDLIFANRVFHHFVNYSWTNSLNEIEKSFNRIHHLLKEDGSFCICDHFFNGLLFDKATSFIIYTLTSCKFEPVVKICNKFGAESAGIGVCFLSKNMWLNIIKANKFKVKTFDEKPSRKMSLLKKLVLLNDNFNNDNIFILTKQ